MTEEKEIRMVGAPEWYGTPLDELDFQWSHEEKLEIERYCEKIHKNLAEEEMTPKERFEATLAGKPRDRLWMEVKTMNVYATTTLDSHSDTLKPVDVYRNPKLLVKAHLATVARFKLDYPDISVITYGEDIWGGKARMIEYGNPVVSQHPIKSMADLEGLEVPDPREVSLYPGYLWACREMRRIFDEYGLTNVMPIWPDICPTQEAGVMLNMMGFAETMKNLHRDQELSRRCIELHTEFSIRFGQAVIEAAKPDALFFCSLLGVIPVKGSEWIVDEFTKVCKALSPFAPVTGAPAYPHSGWLPTMYERGALGPDTFRGNLFRTDPGWEKVVDFHRERDLYCSCFTSNKIVLDGPVSAIEEETKNLCEYGKPYPKFAIAIGVVDYWTPPPHLDAAVAAAKKYGKY